MKSLPMCIDSQLPKGKNFAFRRSWSKPLIGEEMPLCAFTTLHRPVTNSCLFSSTFLLGMCVPNTYKMTHRPGIAFDIIIVIDAVWFADKLNDFFTDLSVYMESIAIGNVDGCHNKFALVGFGRLNDPPKVYSTTNGDKLYGFNAFLTLFKSLNRTVFRSRNGHDGFWAMHIAMTDIPLRNSTEKCHVERTMFLATVSSRRKRRYKLSGAGLYSRLAQLNIRLHSFGSTGISFAVFSHTGVHEGRSVDHVCKKRPASTRLLDSEYGSYFNLTIRSGGIAWSWLSLYTDRITRDCWLNETVSQARFRSGDCVKCSCNGNGVMQCQSVNESTSAECACIAGNSLVSTFRHYYTVEHCN